LVFQLFQQAFRSLAVKARPVLIPPSKNMADIINVRPPALVKSNFIAAPFKRSKPLSIYPVQLLDRFGVMAAGNDGTLVKFRAVNESKENNQGLVIR
jgi:hypothetical protein